MGRVSTAEQRLKRFFREIERKYGLSEAGYRALYKAQGGRCYVCRKASGKARLLGVDHDHLTGEVRGLVCTGSLNAMTCNRLIAIYSRQALIRAVRMLSDPPPAREVLLALQRGEEPPSLVAETPAGFCDNHGVPLAQCWPQHPHALVTEPVG